jgi:hypothetical protein
MSVGLLRMMYYYYFRTLPLLPVHLTGNQYTTSCIDRGGRFIVSISSVYSFLFQNGVFERFGVSSPADDIAF